MSPLTNWTDSESDTLFKIKFEEWWWQGKIWRAVPEPLTTWMLFRIGISFWSEKTWYVESQHHQNNKQTPSLTTQQNHSRQTKRSKVDLRIPGCTNESQTLRGLGKPLLQSLCYASLHLLIVIKQARCCGCKVDEHRYRTKDDQLRARKVQNYESHKSKRNMKSKARQ